MSARPGGPEKRRGAWRPGGSSLRGCERVRAAPEGFPEGWEVCEGERSGETIMCAAYNPFHLAYGQHGGSVRGIEQHISHGYWRATTGLRGDRGCGNRGKNGFDELWWGASPTNAAPQDPPTPILLLF